MSNNNDTHLIHPCNLPTLLEKAEKMARRAKKLGCTPPTFTVLGEKQIKVQREMPGGRLVQFEETRIEVAVTGDTPMLAGWTLVAKVEYLGDEKLVSCVPGQTCPVEFRTRDMSCDHCNTKRHRKEVFVLNNGDQYIQVGRNCISDFLGGVSPESLIWMAECMMSMDREGSECEGGGGSYIPQGCDTLEFLCGTAICIRRFGWTSKSQSPENSTASQAWELMCPVIKTSTDRKRYQQWVESNDLKYQDRDRKQAEAALAWAQALDSDNDYLYNLGVVARAGFVTYRTSGLAASMISSYMRHLDRQNELYLEKTTKTRDHVGEVGKRIDFTNLTVKRMQYIDGMYGTTTLVTFEDEPGNLIKWFASVNLDKLEEGDVVNLKATIKKHDVYNDVKQTLITRAKIAA